MKLKDVVKQQSNINAGITKSFQVLEKVLVNYDERIKELENALKRIQEQSSDKSEST